MRILPSAAAHAFLLCCVVSPSVWAQPVEEAKNSPTVLMTLTLPRLLETLTTFEKIAAQVIPEEIRPGMLRGQLGQMLGDPELANLEPEKPVVLLLTEPSPASPIPGYVLFIPAKAAAPFDQALGVFGLQTDYVDGVLVVAQDPEALTAGRVNLKHYKLAEKSASKVDLSLDIDVETALRIYGTFLDVGLSEMEGLFGGLLTEGPEELRAQLELSQIMTRAYLHVARSVLHQSKTLELELTFTPNAADAKVTYLPLTGTPMEGFLNFPAPTANRVPALIPRPYAAAELLQLEPKRFSRLIGWVLNEAQQSGPKIETLLTPEASQSFLELIAHYDGNFAMALTPTEGAPLGYTYVGEVSDGAVALEATAVWIERFGQDGDLAKVLQTGPLASYLKLTRDVRKHQGVSLHRVTTTFKDTLDDNDAAERIQQLQAAYPKEYDFGWSAGYFVGGTSSSVVDGLIEKLQAPPAEAAPMAAMTRYGAAQNVYIDVDIGALLESLSVLVPAEERDQEALGKVIAALKKGSPAVGAASFQNGQAIKQFHVPLAGILSAFHELNN